MSAYEPPGGMFARSSAPAPGDFTAPAALCLHRVVAAAHGRPEWQRLRPDRHLARRLAGHLPGERPLLTIGHPAPAVAGALLDAVGPRARIVRSRWGDAGMPGPAQRAGAVRDVTVSLPLIGVSGGTAIMAEPHRCLHGTRLIVVDEPSTVDVIRGLHQVLWTTTTLDAAGGPDSELEACRDILAELATGATDAAAARSLHLSDRTMSRRIKATLDRLGASSRFQAGVIAARRGLI